MSENDSIDETSTPEPRGRHAAPSQAPRPGVALFAALFVLGMLFNLYWDATHIDYEGAKITIFLGTAALLVLGVDVGKMIGRR